jgi:hypothetical protein
VVDYHPSYHALMALGAENRVPSFAWGPDAGKPGAMVARSTLSMLHYQVCTGVDEWRSSGAPATLGVPPRAAHPFTLHGAPCALQTDYGTSCPLTMTFAVRL